MLEHDRIYAVVALGHAFSAVRESGGGDVADKMGEEIKRQLRLLNPETEAVQKVLTDADAMADLNGTPRPDHPTGKTLHNSTVSGARQNVKDLVVYGNGDTFKLICKASSAAEGWMKSTKAMEIPGVGCVIQVTTQQGDNIAEAVTFVPGVRIEEIDGDKMNGRRIVAW